MNKTYITWIIVLICIACSIQATNMSIDTADILEYEETEVLSVTITSNASIEGILTISLDNMNTSSVTYDVNTTDPVFTYTFSAIPIEISSYSIDASLKKNGSIIATATKTGIINDTTEPKITYYEVISKNTSVVITVTTNEISECRYAETKKAYDTMEIFQKTDGTSHELTLSGLSGTYTYQVVCKDTHGNSMAESEPITFTVQDTKPQAIITLDKTSPLKEGTVTITLVTSERLRETPKLSYSLSDKPDVLYPISLSGSEDSWQGYMVVTNDLNKKVGTFHFSGIDLSGNTGTNIQAGKLFLIDTEKPEAPQSIGIKKNANDSITLEWYYEGEEVDSYNIYRKKSPGAGYVDFYKSTDDTIFTDTDIASNTEYYYKVSAVDKAGNNGELSAEVHEKVTPLFQERKTNVEEPKTVTEPKKVYELPVEEKEEIEDSTVDLLKEAESLLLSIAWTRQELNEVADDDLKMLYDLYDVHTSLNKTEEDLRSMVTEIEKIRDQKKFDDTRDTNLARIELKLKKYRQSVIREITIQDKSEYIDDTDTAAIKSSAEEVFMYYSDLTSSQRKNLISKAEDIHDSLEVAAELLMYRIEFFNQNKKKGTLVTKSLTYKSPEKLENMLVIENIPKDMAGSASDINFIDKSHRVLNDDPVIEWKFQVIDYNTITVSYYMDTLLDSDTVMKSKTVVLPDPEFENNIESGIFGYFIFDIFQESRMYSIAGIIFLLLGISTIISLIIYYRSLDRPEILSRPEQLMLINIKTLIHDTKEALRDESVEEAVLRYHMLKQEYGLLPQKLKMKVHTDCIDLHKRIVKKRG